MFFYTIFVYKNKIMMTPIRLYEQNIALLPKLLGGLTWQC